MKLEDIAVFIEKDQAIVPKEILSYHLPKAHSPAGARAGTAASPGVGAHDDSF